MKKISAILLALVLLFSLAPVAYAAETPVLSYELQLTDQNGMPVEDPRSLSNGDILNVELVLRRTDKNGAYDLYGIEFRLHTIGLEYNNDGSTLRSGTDVREENYSDGKYVGFAWYDMQQVGESINNPVLAGRWSYTVSNAKIVNIRVPVALVYIKGQDEGVTATGPAKIKLDLNLNGGELVGDDITGKYVSGTVLTLPDAKREGYTFVGWSDGLTVYPAGSQFVVSGIVTLDAVWETPELNRHLTLEPNGGEIVGEDVTGYYADGMIVTLPDAQREGYKFQGWSDGTAIYGAGDEYVVTNTVILTALWEAIAEEPIKGDPSECIICGRERWLVPVIGICWICLLILILILLGIWLINLLWKRKTVKYSLVNGDIVLDYKNGDRDAQVEVVLVDEGRKLSLGKSGIVKAKERLKFIQNVQMLPIADVKPGKYKGRLVIRYGRAREVRKCRIQVLDKELKET